MTLQECNRTKRACYFSYLASSSVFSLPPLLFATFREMYGISYTLLGTLVLLNFFTQLGVDLIFSFFGKRFNLHAAIRLIPLLTSIGLIVYALSPILLPQYTYAGLVLGTLLFSVAAGLDEVLMSPTIAALPSKTPEKDMSTLHSLYGYGFVAVVVISTLFLEFVGNQYWMYLTFFWAVLPVIASVMLYKSKLPELQMGNSKNSTAHSKHRTKGLLLCMVCIFFASCTENTMANWISAYTENALNMPKVWGDLLGMSLFATFLALTRTFYAKYGKNISKVMFVGMLGSVACYLVTAFSTNATISLIACVAVGVCSSMLWPGTLIFMEEKIPAAGVAAYALMAAGGDFGASFAPQALGAVIDGVSATNWAANLGVQFSLSPEQIGFKSGMLLTAFFPLCGIAVLLCMKKHFKKVTQ